MTHSGIIGIEKTEPIRILYPLDCKTITGVVITSEPFLRWTKKYAPKACTLISPAVPKILS